MCAAAVRLSTSTPSAVRDLVLFTTDVRCLTLFAAIDQLNIARLDAQLRSITSKRLAV